MFSKVKQTSLAAIAAAGMIASVSAGAAKAEGNMPEFSANVAITSDYIFRGVSQTAEGPAIQGGFDVTWNILYAGVWASNIDFGGAPSDCGNLTDTGDCANIEVDLYAGITPKLGPVDLDLGVIYYVYPKAIDPTAELDYVEIKGGASVSPVDNLTVGATVYYSPEFTAQSGETWTVEGSAELSLPYDFALSGLVGTLQFNDATLTDYTYWKVGLSKTFLEKYTAEVAYWDTDLPDSACQGPLFHCDARIVGTLSASF